MLIFLLIRQQSNSSQKTFNQSTTTGDRNMSMLAQAALSLKSMWSHGDDYDSEEEYDGDEPATSQASSAKYSDHKYSSSNFAPTYGGGGGTTSKTRSLRSVPIPLRAREKNIYTLRPKTLEESAIAADYLKAGSAVVVNLESVAHESAVRIIDFMSGVCYGLENQGHAMKLGDSIFLFTPGEFEISSDELDYGENRDFFFKQVEEVVAVSHTAAPTSSAYSAPTNTPVPNAYTSSFANSYNTPQQHSVNASATAPMRPQATPLAQPQTAVPPQAPRAQATPSYSVSGQSHVTIGGRPAPTSVLTPAPRPTNASRSWER
jgi:cell division inhibitor SepF